MVAARPNAAGFNLRWRKASFRLVLARAGWVQNEFPFQCLQLMVRTIGLNGHKPKGVHCDS